MLSKEVAFLKENGFTVAAYNPSGMFYDMVNEKRLHVMLEFDNDNATFQLYFNTGTPICTEYVKLSTKFLLDPDSEAWELAVYRMELMQKAAKKLRHMLELD
jgi:hypothetical protein